MRMGTLRFCARPEEEAEKRVTDSHVRLSVPVPWALHPRTHAPKVCNISDVLLHFSRVPRSCSNVVRAKVLRYAQVARSPAAVSIKHDQQGARS